MKCCVCGKQPIKDNVSMVAIDPPGTPNRRWSCVDHVDKNIIPEDIRELCKIFDVKYDGEFTGGKN